VSGLVYVPVVSFKGKEVGTYPDQNSDYQILKKDCSTDSKVFRPLKNSDYFTYHLFEHLNILHFAHRTY
jgi:hypothetical protein